MGRSEHIKSICESAVNLLRKRLGLDFVFYDMPDQIVRDKPAIDYRYKSNGLWLLVEHTQIESFEEQTLDGQLFAELFNPIEAELKGNMPKPGSYHLTVKVGAFRGIKKIKRDQVRKSIKNWVMEKGPKLEVYSQFQKRNSRIVATPPGVPFELSLRRDPGVDGLFLVARYTPENIEDKRLERFRRALEQKCPKLKTAKDTSSLTCLVLESQDIALGSYGWVEEKFRILVSESNDDVPDCVYYIDADMQPWAIYILKEKEILLPDYPVCGPYLSIHQEEIKNNS